MKQNKTTTASFGFSNQIEANTDSRIQKRDSTKSRLKNMYPLESEMRFPLACKGQYSFYQYQLIRWAYIIMKKNLLSSKSTDAMLALLNILQLQHLVSCLTKHQGTANWPKSIIICNIYCFQLLEYKLSVIFLMKYLKINE